MIDLLKRMLALCEDKVMIDGAYMEEELAKELQQLKDDIETLKKLTTNEVEVTAKIRQVSLTCQVDIEDIEIVQEYPYVIIQFDIENSDCEYYFEAYDIRQVNGKNIIDLRNVKVL